MDSHNSITLRRELNHPVYIANLQGLQAISAKVLSLFYIYSTIILHCDDLIGALPLDLLSVWRQGCAPRRRQAGD